jgi:hypothetical protein
MLSAAMKRESLSPKSMRSCGQRWDVSAYSRRDMGRMLLKRQSDEARERIAEVHVELRAALGCHCMFKET